jgi:copper(I)-binding protein
VISALIFTPATPGGTTLDGNASRTRLVFAVMRLQARKDSDVRLQNRRVLGSTGMVAVATGAALLLAGCGAGQITQTATQQPAVNGSYAQVKTLVLRDAALEFPPSGQAYAAGSSAALTLRVINQGPSDDELLSVSSVAADSATVTGSKVIVAGHTLVIGPVDQVEATGDQTAPSASTQATTSSPDTSTSSTDTTSPTSSTSSTSVEPPVTVGEASVLLQGLKQPVWSGQTIKVTFTFRDAGPVTVDLPIAAPVAAAS